MNNHVYLNDNAGHIVPPAGAPDPVAGSGQTLTNSADDTDTEVTVVAGAQYALTAQEVGGFYLGIADVITDAANIIWACPGRKTIIIVIPRDVIVLHYAADVDNAVGYLRKLATR